MKSLTLSPRSPDFLSLPPEVRQQIYALVTKTVRLSTFAFVDPEWSLKPAESEHGRGVPPLCFTCHKVYNETIALVYSQAVLEIAPIRGISNYFLFATSAGDSEGVLPVTYTELTDTYRFCRPDLFRLIKRAHIYNNQANPIVGPRYDSLLQWLVENTNVVDVQVSGRAMVRLGEQPRFDADKVISSFANPVPCKLVRLWTAEPIWHRWEWIKINKLYARYDEQKLPHVQIYFLCPGQSHGTLHLDPRWFVKGTSLSATASIDYGLDGHYPTHEFERACSWIDSFVQQTVNGDELACYERRRRYKIGDSWLYQMIVVPS